MTARDLDELVEYLQSIDHRLGRLDVTEVQAMNVLRQELLQVSLAVRRVVDLLASDLEERES
ncbi:MAG TPA: hypothetical protein VGD78_21625 [Chthoniobacterales bacterium]